MTRHFRPANFHGPFLQTLLVGLIAVLAIGQANDCFAGKKKRASFDEQIATTLRYMPQRTTVIGSIDVQAFLRSDLLREATGGKLPDLDFPSAFSRLLIGVSLDKISRITLAGKIVDGQPCGVLVMHLSKSLEPDVIAKHGQKGTASRRPEETDENHQVPGVYSIKGTMRVADPRTLVWGNLEMLDAVMDREQPPPLSARMKAAVAALDPTQPLTVAVAMQDLLQDSPYQRYFPLSDEVFDGIGPITINADFDATPTVQLATVCRDESIAWQLQGFVSGLWQLVLTTQFDNGNIGSVSPDTVEIMRTARFDVQQRTFSMNVQIPVAALSGKKSPVIITGWQDADDDDYGYGWVEEESPSVQDSYYRSRSPRKFLGDEDDARDSKETSLGPQAWDTNAPGPIDPKFAELTAEVDRALERLSDDRDDAAADPSDGWPPSSGAYDASNDDASVDSGAIPGYYPATNDYGNASRYSAYPRTTALRVYILGEVARMSSAGLDEQVILAYVQRHVDRGGTVPEMDADDLIELHKSGIASGVLLGLMQLAVEREQTSEERKEASEERKEAPLWSDVAPAAVSWDTVQVAFWGPEGTKSTWETETTGELDSESLLVWPSPKNSSLGTRRLKVWNLPNRPGVVLCPTLEIVSGTALAEEYLARNQILVRLTDEDVDAMMTDNPVTKVIYLPDREFQEFAIARAETVVSTRLAPGVDPVVEAERRGEILAIIGWNVMSDTPPEPDSAQQPSPTHGKRVKTLGLIDMTRRMMAEHMWDDQPKPATQTDQPGATSKPTHAQGASDPSWPPARSDYGELPDASGSLYLPGSSAAGCQSAASGGALRGQKQATDDDQETQQTNADASDFIFYDHEFVGTTAELIPVGRTHLEQVALRLDHVPFPVIVEQTPGNRNPTLDQQRRQTIIDHLTRAGATGHEPRVVIAPAFNSGITAEEDASRYYSTIEDGHYR
ncbi:MAG: hypothetical protein HQ581_23000 [Planctomycetes bacterium]|nr:hypothetical protein [Planctomycetota bacterium]